MDKTTQHLVDAAKALADGLDGHVDRDRWRVSPNAMRDLRVHTLRVAIKDVEDAAPPKLTPTGDYDVKLVGLADGMRAILEIVGGPSRFHHLFVPLKFILPSTFRVHVDIALEDGHLRNEVRRASDTWEEKWL